MRLIDADELQKQINDLEFQCRSMLWSGEEMYEECLCAVLNMIANAPTITPPPNAPLTPEQLREMDEEPVWVCHPLDKRSGAYALIDLHFDMCRVAGGGIAIFENYGKTWLAYRRKPEEGIT